MRCAIVAALALLAVLPASSFAQLPVQLPDPTSLVPAVPTAQPLSLIHI